MSLAAPRMLKRYTRAVVRRAVDPFAYLPAPRREPTTTPTAGVVGFYGWGNYGDELFLDVFREHLEPPFHLRTVLDPLAGRVRGRGVGRAVRASDLMLIGGGDIVIPWTPHSRYWEKAYLRRPVFVAGVGVPTWGRTTPGGLAFLRRFFTNEAVRFIGTRDAASSAWIRENLDPPAPIVTSPDLVWGLTLPAATRIADPPVFGVAVRRRRQEDDLTQVRRLCLRAQELGYRVRRIVLATGRTRLRDIEATDELDLPGTELVSSDDLSVISQAIGECTAMASMKFHGFVVATMYGVPCFVMMPTAKNRYLIEAIGRPDLLSVYNDPALADRLTAAPTPIATDVRDRLSADARSFLADLRERMLAAAAEA